MKEDILTFSFIGLMALFIAGFFLAVRYVFKISQSTIVKVVQILGFSFFLAVFSLVTFLLVAFSTNPWAH